MPSLPRITIIVPVMEAMETIGAELTRVEHGVVEIELPFDVKLTQQHGILHAGIISAALDSACGF
ncbi:PaaI family thioesterase, partial [Rhizobium ruizarguesonis]